VQIKTEHDEQKTLFEWAAYNWNKYPELEFMFAIPNGGKRDVVTAKRLKDEGVKAGVSDIFLPAIRWSDPSGSMAIRYGGLFIEMKSEDGRLSQAQIDFIAAMKKQGYQTAVCWSADEAISTIEEYLGA